MYMYYIHMLRIQLIRHLRQIQGKGAAAADVSAFAQNGRYHW